MTGNDNGILRRCASIESLGRNGLKYANPLVDSSRARIWTPFDRLTTGLISKGGSIEACNFGI